VCSLAGLDRRFRRAYLVHHQSDDRLHGAISQKTLIFILDAVRTSNLTKKNVFIPWRSYCFNTVSLKSQIYQVTLHYVTGVSIMLCESMIRSVVYKQIQNKQSRPVRSRLGGVVVSVLATGPKGCGFEPGKGDGLLRATKIRSTPSFGWEVKPEVPCLKI
jgi:hypothetical protein